MPSAEEAWMALTKRTSAVAASEAGAAFAALGPATAEQLTRGGGRWAGADLDTGHPASRALAALRWAGKTFRGADDVDPVVVYDAHGSRSWSPDWGRARLREARAADGPTTVAMIYDDFPIIDYFRYVGEDVVAGAMDARESLFGTGDTYYFYLERLK